MSINSNHSFLAYRSEIGNVNAWLQARIRDACGYPARVLVDRLVQRVVELSLYPYAASVRAVLRAGGRDCFPSRGSLIRCGCASFEAGAGAVQVSLRQHLANQLDFLLHWAYCLLAIILPTRAISGNQPAVLVFGVGNESLFADGSDQRFVTYCQSGPIRLLARAKKLLVQFPRADATSTSPDFVYCPRPLIRLLRSTRLGVLGKLSLAIKHLGLLFRYATSCVRFPALSLLAKDFAYGAISNELDRLGLIEAIVFTTSNYGSQPLWVRELRNSRTHLIWYAQNFKPVTYLADRTDSDIPAALWIRVDTHWVWTHAFADHLRLLGHRGSIEVVGPIVWYLPELKQPSRSAIDLVVFDISPSSDDVALQVGGYISNFNSAENLHAFIADVAILKASLAAKFQLPVSIRLKTKRGYDPIYDKGYFDYLDQLNSAGVISLVEHSTNIYALISSSHLVIVYPFTSPAYIAESLRVPSIYYDPTASIIGQNFGDIPDLIHFASGREDLLKKAGLEIEKILARPVSRESASVGSA